MVDHPDPILGDDLGAQQGRQPDPQEPEPASRPIGRSFLVACPRPKQPDHAGRTPQRRRAVENRRYEPEHHGRGKLLAAGSVLLGAIER